MLLISPGCSLFNSKEFIPPDFREDFSLLDPGEFPEKIKELEEISQYHKSYTVRTRAMYYLAMAHLHYNNPSRDYSRALDYLDKYIAVDMKNQDIDEIVAWKSTLLILVGALEEVEKLEESYARLKHDLQGASKNRELLNHKVKELEGVIVKQKQEIRDLEETIKKLDVVQREIEKKKKKIKQ
jgi:hypothetical protein